MTSVTVETRPGSLRGEERDGVHVWRGIPYAAPPVGGLRFRPPEPMQHWAGVRDATRWAPTAMQPLAFRLGQQVNIPEPRTSEDCLYLNVWAPAASETPSRSWSGSTAADSSRTPAAMITTTAPVSCGTATWWW